jgi:uncharacterized protein YqjF (DUF2071 family)
MLNYEVDPAQLQPLLPLGTELDNWNGKTFMSMVGFLFLDTRVFGLPIPFHRNFEEVNLRFYVRRRVGDEWRRGVVFVKEIVRHRTIAAAARYFYNENYVALPTSHVITFGSSAADPESVQYHWKHGGKTWSLRAVAGNPVSDLIDGSEEAFIAEHYWGYSRQRDGSTVEYRVDHKPWRRIWRCEPGIFEGDASELYGATLAASLHHLPSSTFIAAGSAVAVHRGERLPALR